MEEEKRTRTGHEILQERKSDWKELRDNTSAKCMYQQDAYHNAIVRGRVPTSALQKAKFGFLSQYEKGDATRTTHALADRVRNKMYNVFHRGYRIHQSEFRDDASNTDDVSDIIFRLERRAHITISSGIREAFSRMMQKNRSSKMIPLSQFISHFETTENVDCTRNLIHSFICDVAYLRCLSDKENTDNLLHEINGEPYGW